MAEEQTCVNNIEHPFEAIDTTLPRVGRALVRPFYIKGNTMKKIIAVASAAVLGLGLAACEGSQENAAEDIGEQQAEMVDEQVEAMEDAGQITDDQEDALTDAAEDRADAMEAAGDAADEAQ